MNLDLIKNKIRNIPDFPKPGIQYKDITPVLQNYDVFQKVINLFYDEFKILFIRLWADFFKNARSLFRP